MFHPLRRTTAPVSFFFAVLAALAALWLIAPPPAEGQYLYLDTNGDGAWSAADVIAPTGATTIDVWLRTDTNRDGSAAVCVTGDGALTMTGYQVILAAANGTVTWGAPANARAEFPTDYGTANDASEITIGFGGGASLAPGAYKLCTVSATVATGTPAVGFATSSALAPGYLTAFFSACSGTELDNAIRWGTDFADADGAAYGGVANRPPALQPIPDVTVPEGTVQDVPVVASDPDGDPVTLALTSGPAWASLTTSGGGSGSVHLAPGYSDAGDAQASVAASDAFATVRDTFAIHVPDVNRPPVLAQPSDMMASEGIVSEMGISADDPDGDPMTFYLASGPSFVTVTTVNSQLGSATGLVRSAPGYSDAGMVTITVGVRDASLSDEKSYTLMVRNVDRPPVLTAPVSVSAAEGDRVEFDAVSTDPDGEIPSLAAAGLPSGATLTDRMDGTARFHWVPPFDAAGDYSVVVTADDRAGETAAATTAVSVATTTAPLTLAQPDDMTIVAGHAASQILSALDASGDAVTFALDSGPAYAAVSPLDPVNGVARAALDVSTPASAAGQTTPVTVSATDGVNHVTRTFTLAVLDPASLPGKTPFAPPFRSVSTGLTPHTVTVADVDGDRLLDLVTANLGSSTVSTYHGFGNLTFDTRRDFVTAANPHTVIVGDLNRDGIPDLAMSEMGGHAVGSRLGTGGGAFGSIAQCAMTGSPMYLGLADFDGDGTLDAVATNLTAGTLEYFHGNGDGTFTRGADYPTGANAHGLVIGDVNRDGKPDVVVANPGSGTVTVLLGRGDGTFDRKPDFTTSSPHTLNLADLDGDGILDLLVVNFDTGTVTILRGAGDGTFTDPQEIPTGANAHGGAIADVDGDGIPDILVANQGAGTLSVLMGRGGMRFAPKTDFAVTAGAHSIAVADLDGDGDLDVAVSGITGNAVTILENRTPPLRPARAWPENGDRKFVDRGGKPIWTVRVESADGAFRPEDVAGPVWLASEFLAQGYRAYSMPPKSWSVGDADRDGIPDLGIPFTRETLLGLFGQVTGRFDTTIGIHGYLADGSKFLAGVHVEVVGAGPPGKPAVAPNPLNPSGALSFTLERAGAVRIAIYDVRGRLVRRIADGARYPAGPNRIEIDGKDERGAPLASGIYFFEIETADGVRSGRFAVLK